MTDLDQSTQLLELIPQIMRALRTEMRKTAKNSAHDDFTVPQFRILNQLSRKNFSNQELAEWMGVSAPTMSKLIDRLVDRGLAVRKQISSDRRQISLGATPEGKKRALRIRGFVQEIFAKRIARLSPRKKRELSAGLNVLQELIQS